MPAKSKAQQAYFAMCEHGKIACPGGLKSKGVTKKVAKEFASTPTKNLPKRKTKKGK